MCKFYHLTFFTHRPKNAVFLAKKSFGTVQFDYLAVIKYHHSIVIDDRIEPVRNRQDRQSRKGLANRFLLNLPTFEIAISIKAANLNQAVRVVVDRGGGLVEH